MRILARTRLLTDIRLLTLVRTALVLTALFTAAAASAQGPAHVYLTWQGDTGSTMTVNFHTMYAAESSTVLFDTLSRSGNAAAYPFRAEGDAHQIPGVEDGRYVHRVELTGLVPGATYYFTAGDSASGYTEERRFRTIPDDLSPIRFVTGGDMGVSEDVPPLLRYAAGWDPQFALIGGDLAYVNGDVRRVDLWDRWLDMWMDEMVTSDGLTVPMVLAVGNHEVQGGYNGGVERAPFYFGLFAQNGNPSYFRRTFGSLMSVYVLDTGHVVPHEGAQTAWLEEQLRADRDIPYRFALYHIPLYPSHRSYDGTYSELGRTHWLPLFDQYDLTAAFENHDHTFKRSHLMRNGGLAQDESDGVLYIGDGAWGRPPREIDLSPRWYLAKSGAQQHVWVVDVSEERVVYRAFDINGRLIDVHPAEVEGAADADAYFETLPQRYAIASRAITIDPVTADGAFHRDSIRVRLFNSEAYRVDVELSVHPESPLSAAPVRQSVSLEPDETASLAFELSAPSSIEPSAVPGAFIEAELEYHTPRGRVSHEERLNIGIETRMEAARAPADARVDGVLGEWESLPFVFDRPSGTRPSEDHFTTDLSDWNGASDASIRFNVAHDTRFVYVSMDVRDDRVMADPDLRPWDDSDESLPHDGVAIWLDPFPGGEGDDDPLVVVSPDTTSGGVRFAAGDSSDDDLPAGLQISGATTPGGYIVEAAIPLRHLFSSDAGSDAVRLNLAISDKDVPDQRPHYYFWRPPWESSDDFDWSGVFRLTPGP